MSNKVFYGFLILVLSALLWLLPIADLIYSFQTDNTENSFYVTTAPGTTNATVTLNKAIYDDNTSTIIVLSDLNSDLPTYTSYNTTTRATVFTGLTSNASRTLDVTYDTDALDSSTWATVLSIFPKILLILNICFPIAGIAAMFIRRD